MIHEMHWVIGEPAGEFEALCGDEHTVVTMTAVSTAPHG
jgi:hypothetical protein